MRHAFNIISKTITKSKKMLHVENYIIVFERFGRLSFQLYCNNCFVLKPCPKAIDIKNRFVYTYRTILLEKHISIIENGKENSKL